MELVRTHTSIPVPKCDRSVIPSTGRVYLIQQYIPGRVLHDAWPSFGWWNRFCVALTLRYYIHQLRRLSRRLEPLPGPGPPSINGEAQMCTGRLFTSDGSGPFSSYHEMARWYQNRLLAMQRFRKEYFDTAPFDSNAPLVFTHMDLHLRNMILGDDGQLWIIDWADAGWYPSWFESASMSLFSVTQPEVPPSWSEWISFIAGSCQRPGQFPFIEAISYSLEMMRSQIVNLVSLRPSFFYLS
jgi:hypothetical protein